jgi:hypothetical protein
MKSPDCYVGAEYLCHKRVRAARITSVEGSLIGFDGAPTLDIGAAWVRKHKPREGGYFVTYEDGYQSFSPASAFEAGYTLVAK